MKEIDNQEVQEVLEILEGIEDETAAVRLLKEFNDCTRELGLLLMNRDKNLSHEDWEEECAKTKKRVDEVLNEIRSYR